MRHYNVIGNIYSDGYDTGYVKPRKARIAMLYLAFICLLIIATSIASKQVDTISQISMEEAYTHDSEYMTYQKGETKCVK